METVGDICSYIMTIWATIELARLFVDNKYLDHFINETLFIIPIVVIAWFLFAGDVTSFTDMVRLFGWGWIWYEAHRDHDDRWKRRKKRLTEKVKVLSSGKLAVVAK